MVYVFGLTSEKDGKIRTRILTKLEDNNDITLEHLSEDCQLLFNLEHDSAMVASLTPLLTAKSEQFASLVGSDSASVVKKRSVQPHRIEAKYPVLTSWCATLRPGFSYKHNKCSNLDPVRDTARAPSPGRTRRFRKPEVPCEVVVVNGCSVQQRRRVHLAFKNGHSAATRHCHRHHQRQVPETRLLPRPQ